MDINRVPQALRPLLPEFVASGRETLARVREAVAAGEWEAARKAAHALKGSCQLFQLRELGEAARLAEEALLRGEGAREELREFEELLEAVASGK
ncbi:Hpt domain-containing protein [Fundidesulfovibrio soli]|uniref:Hpt domain-containing protein n=1 Tax=Fundidesulfovibrio soli TaxID=2922716 RepID=UPI001FAED3B3